MTDSLEKQFRDQLADIEREASALGETWSSICRALGISRATPDRWRGSDDPPRTIQIVDQMREYLRKKKREQERAAARRA